jgi:hypothetical protein
LPAWELACPDRTVRHALSSSTPVTHKTKSSQVTLLSHIKETLVHTCRHDGNPN